MVNTISNSIMKQNAWNVCRTVNIHQNYIILITWNLYHKCNVELADDIQAKIKNLHGDMNKKVLANIIGETIVMHIADKDIPIDNLTEWNPYIMQFHRSNAKDLLRKRLKYPAGQIRRLAKIGGFTEQELYKLIIGKISTKEKILEEPLNKFKRDLVKEIFGEGILKMVEESC